MTVDAAIETVRRLAAATHAFADRLDAGGASTTDLERFLRDRGRCIEALPDRAAGADGSERLERAIYDLLAADRRIARWCARRRVALRRALSTHPTTPSRQRIVSDEV
ncbi:MAG: hypothetical protein D6705_06425 [Deltaproteobacteria bacterium]|nr:MAG: hypothetical protein D6705_06425 [Deltaproteobacteria bacterium]